MTDKPVVDDDWRFSDELWKQIELLLPAKNRGHFAALVTKLMTLNILSSAGMLAL